MNSQMLWVYHLHDKFMFTRILPESSAYFEHDAYAFLRTNTEVTLAKRHPYHNDNTC